MTSWKKLAIGARLLCEAVLVAAVLLQGGTPFESLVLNLLVLIYVSNRFWVTLNVSRLSVSVLTLLQEAVLAKFARRGQVGDVMGFSGEKKDRYVQNLSSRIRKSKEAVSEALRPGIAESIIIERIAESEMLVGLLEEEVADQQKLEESLRSLATSLVAARKEDLHFLESSTSLLLHVILVLNVVRIVIGQVMV